MNKRCWLLPLCVMLLLCLMAGCSGKSVKLTDAQKARVDWIVQNREQWDEVSELAVTYPTNRVYIEELGNSEILLTVAHEIEGTGSNKGWSTYVAQGYLVGENSFQSANQYSPEWSVASVEVDMDNMSDTELTKALEEAYIAFLSRN